MHPSFTYSSRERDLDLHVRHTPAFKAWHFFPCIEFRWNGAVTLLSKVFKQQEGEEEGEGQCPHPSREEEEGEGQCPRPSREEEEEGQCPHPL